MVNKRDAFRVDFSGKHCRIGHNFRYINGYLCNVSALGAEIEVYREKLGEEVTLEFTLIEEDFVKECKVVRETYVPDGRVKYGLKFHEQSERDRDIIHQKLFKVEADRRAKALE